mmetsp:Transcript_5086/g.4446  ORF Transcript_5086/g.4446 Transcript_5086/m.4446 type:complete len:134 (-) Transcript_5086:20-421(-)
MGSDANINKLVGGEEKEDTASGTGSGSTGEEMYKDRDRQTDAGNIEIVTNDGNTIRRETVDAEELYISQKANDQDVMTPKGNTKGNGVIVIVEEQKNDDDIAMPDTQGMNTEGDDGYEVARPETRKGTDGYQD